MARFYHGSLSHYVVDGTSYHVKRYLKKIERRLERRELPAEIAQRLQAYDRFVARRDWDNLRQQAVVLARYAEEQNDARLMRTLAKALWRLGEYRRATALHLAGRQLSRGVDPMDWDGGNISDKHLLISLPGRDLGSTILLSLAVPHAARQAARTTVVTLPRLVPLFDRSFDTVEVVAPDAVGGDGAYDKRASSRHLAALTPQAPGAKDFAFMPLVPDRGLVHAFRETYRRSGSGPLIGISWGSKNHHKVVPGFADWRDFLRTTPATFVSLQYGDIVPALRRLRRGVPYPLIYDETVDQLKDMDLFAAQVAAMDAVITIPNTCAHLTGALAVPGVLIKNDGFGGTWPVIGDRVPWYPKLALVRREGRAWREVFGDVRQKLRSLLPELT